MNKKIFKSAIMSIAGLFVAASPVFAESVLYDEMLKNAVEDNKPSQYVVGENGIDFAHTSSDTNGKGIYIDTKTSTDDKKVLYYRGDIDNNFVLLDDNCFQILRTTVDGQIKLLYAGGATDGKCLATGSAQWALPDKVQYNLTNAEGSEFMTRDENGVQNKVDSNIKKVLEQWYEDTYLNKANIFVDAIYCNDRQMHPENHENDNGHYDAYFRVIEGKPTFTCEPEDSFSVSTELGNGILKYPVGLITADEVIYAGGQYYEVDPDNYYNSWALTDAAYWSLTPNSVDKILYPNSKGYLNRNSASATSGLRPVLAINGDSTYTKGNGTRENPYVIPNYQYKVEVDDNSVSNVKLSYEGGKVVIDYVKKDGLKFNKFIIVNLETNEEEEIEIVKDSGAFSITMPKHDILVRADYVEDTGEEKEEATGEEEEANPQTSDSLFIYCGIFLVSLGSLLLLKKLN